MRRPTIALLAALAVQSACTAFPDLEVPGLESAARAPYPALIPLTQALASADAPPRFTSQEAAALQARAASIGTVGRPQGTDIAARLNRLRMRAAILRGPLGTEAQIEAMRRALAAL